MTQLFRSCTQQPLVNETGMSRLLMASRPPSLHESGSTRSCGSTDGLWIKTLLTLIRGFGLSQLRREAVPAVWLYRGGRCPPLTRAPADQATKRSTFRMRTSIEKSEDSRWKGKGCDVVFEEAREMMQNDHVVGTPPFVVTPASSQLQWEVSSFLVRLRAIILVRI